MACTQGQPSANNPGWCYTGAMIGSGCVVVNCSSFGITQHSTFRVEMPSPNGGRPQLVTITRARQMQPGNLRLSIVQDPTLLQGAPETESDAPCSCGNVAEQNLVTVESFLVALAAVALLWWALKK